jgi:uncharacterized OB-fold protein
VAPPYPQPREDSTNAPLLAAWRSGHLALQSCSGCGLVFFYPREICPRCWSAELAWIEAGGTGSVVSFSLIQRPLHAAFEDEVPVVLAEIALPEGASLLARVVGDDRSEVSSGRAVRLLSLPEASRYPLPTFRLA